ncbi:MAG: hypothetical protein ACO38Q_04980 [Aquiluna sp.]
MATFQGVFPANELVPAPCGLLSVARVTEHTARDYDERWVRGLDQEFDSMPSYVRLLTVNDATVTNGELTDNQADERFLRYVPFYIDVEDFASTFSLPGQDRFERVKKELEAVTQKALEYEFWTGSAARGTVSAGPPAVYDAGENNMYLTKTGASTVPQSGAFAPQIALMYLEEAISDSPTGENAVIHMTRDVASILGSRLVYKKGEDGKPGRAMTRLGTEVVIGSGYTGSGPVGDTNAAASATNKWIYATSKVDVHLGKIEVVNEDLAQGADVTINNMRIKAYRPAAVYSDPSMHYAMRVTLPTS